MTPRTSSQQQTDSEFYSNTRERLSSTETTVDHLQKELSEIKANLGNLNTRLTTLEGKLTFQSGFVAALKWIGVAIYGAIGSGITILIQYLFKH